MQNMHNKLKNGIEVEEPQKGESVSLAPGDRVALVYFPWLLLSATHSCYLCFSNETIGDK